MRFIFIVLCVYYSSLLFAQKQNNTPGSDVYVDCPKFLDVSKDSLLPVTFYFHENECANCINYLHAIDVRLKCAADIVFSTPLLFDTLSAQQFLAFFSDYSNDDMQWNSQSFINSLPVNDDVHTILFTADTNWWIPPVPVVTINKRYFYFTFNIPFEVWSNYLCSDSIIDVHVYLTIDWDVDEEFWFRVFVTKNRVITVPDWYRGDVHFHAINTQNDAENGLPLELSKRAAKNLGLDWITVTDHSCDFDNYGDSMQANWQLLANKIQQMNIQDSSFLFIRAIEASINNSQGKTVHALVFPDPNNPFQLPYIFDGGGDLIPTNISISKLQDSLLKYHAFCYAAHPFAEGDALPFAVNGGVWNLNDYSSPVNGQPANSVGTVIWNNLSVPSDVYHTDTGIFVLKPALIGFQIMNLFNSIVTTDTDRDPWNTERFAEPFGFVELSETDFMHWYFRYKQNFEAYSTILCRGLKLKNQNNHVENWKPFLIAGSDAHGSFNFSNTDYLYGGVYGVVENNYPGAFSTLVYCPNSMGAYGRNVLLGLKNGNTILSSGPVVVCSIQTPIGSLISGNDADLSNVNENQIFITIQAYTNDYYGQICSAKIILFTQDSVYRIPITLTNGFFTISLRDFFLQNVSLFGTILINQYIAISAEIETQKIYNSVQAVYYRRNSEKFYSITTPIWFKVASFQKLQNFSTCSDLNVYPNPAKDYCFIASANKANRIKMISVEGKNLPIEYSLYEDYIKIQWSDLEDGLYIIELCFENHIERKSIVVHK